jgi:hypothetical protein
MREAGENQTDPGQVHSFEIRPGQDALNQVGAPETSAAQVRITLVSGKSEMAFGHLASAVRACTPPLSLGSGLRGGISRS